MRFTKRRDGGRRRILPVAAAALCSALLVTGTQSFLLHMTKSANTQKLQRTSLAASSGSTSEFSILDATWTTAHIREKGITNAKDTGLVVTYLAPVGRNPAKQGDWIGIYEHGRLEKAHRKDWDWVCPNEHDRCMAYGAAAIPAGDDGLEPGKTYTVAYWANDASESNGTPVATIDYVVPW
ncbi:hypothetical protein AMK21_21875 [Streptomyces sp. CB00316]|uniref:hypothetical protein n=1 Tax=unclassified Streptomyces TaxID=2593676 RepID=UPI00093C9E52|nr:MULTISPECIES: hypothetical protein [unclassified Streptomyces]MBT2376005.1 hypothetical protein [Streptomyces sp. ISL-111]MBT2428105.1 hypothetical protein [Streptomyces sp. ISL-112]MBT2463100.1 hypothetical protein [Streptomyces sp. ISL-63]OKJ18213.1 hypothetical protein AMK21_21875 [Streptomyces sp. CB00316]